MKDQPYPSNICINVTVESNSSTVDWTITDIVDSVGSTNCCNVNDIVMVEVISRHISEAGDVKTLALSRIKSEQSLSCHFLILALRKLH